MRDDLSINQILLDTNAVVNAALLPDSFSALAIRLAMQAGHFQFLISSGVAREVKELLGKILSNEIQRSLAEDRVIDLLQSIDATLFAVYRPRYLGHKIRIRQPS